MLQTVKSPKANPASAMMYVIAGIVDMVSFSVPSNVAFPKQGPFRRRHSASLPTKLSFVNVENWPPVGISPVRLLYETSNLERNVTSVRDVGMLPLRSLWVKFSSSKFSKLDNSSGMPPENLFRLKSST
uniref:Uncharacterized protein n=1 Tax=Triticum urartu TaxID=4572 RepID=A0A8R7TNW0_TRIUA